MGSYLLTIRSYLIFYLTYPHIALTSVLFPRPRALLAAHPHMRLLSLSMSSLAFMRMRHETRSLARIPPITCASDTCV